MHGDGGAGGVGAGGAAKFASPWPVQLSMRVEAGEAARGSRRRSGAACRTGRRSRADRSTARVSASLGQHVEPRVARGQRERRAGRPLQTRQRRPAAQQVAERARERATRRPARARRSSADLELTWAGTAPVLIRAGHDDCDPMRPAVAQSAARSDRQHAGRAAQPPGRAEHAAVWGKLENRQSGRQRQGSHLPEHDRGGGARRAAASPGDTIIEPTSGNTGIGLALVAAVKGYRLVLTMPDTMSEERRSLLMAYGATLVLTPDTQGHARRDAQGRGAAGRAPRLLHAAAVQQSGQSGGASRRPRRTSCCGSSTRIDAFVAGVGTGGTITGVGQVLREAMPGVRIYAVEPAASPVLSGGEPGFHKIQGIGAGFVPEILDHERLRRGHHRQRRGRRGVHAASGARGRHPGRHLGRRQLPRRAAGGARARARARPW